MTTPSHTGYAPVNGLQLYYEVYGAGEPLILLHGGFGLTGMFAPIMPQLAANHQVIAVDLQAHGRTADIDRPLSVEAMGDDVGKLIQYLNLQQANVMGYSMGAATALQCAIQHPKLVRRLVVMSIPFKRSGWYPEQVVAMDQMNVESMAFMKDTPIYEEYVAVAPDPDHFPVFCAKMADLLHHDYDYTEDIKRLTMPVLIIAGDADGFPPTHAVEFFALLGGGQRDGGWDNSGMVPSQLAILPATTHYHMSTSPLVPAVVLPFLATAAE